MDLERAWNDWNDRKGREIYVVLGWKVYTSFFFLSFFKEKAAIFILLFFRVQYFGGLFFFQIDNHKHKMSGDFLALDINQVYTASVKRTHRGLSVVTRATQ